MLQIVASLTIITYDHNSFIIQATGRRYLQRWPEELDAFRRPNSPHRPLEEPHESLAVALHGADQDHHLQIISVELCGINQAIQSSWSKGTSETNLKL